MTELEKLKIGYKAMENGYKKSIEELKEIKEIYKWDDDMNSGFIDSVKNREEIFNEYYECFDTTNSGKIKKLKNNVMESQPQITEFKAHLLSQVCELLPDEVIKNNDIDKLKKQNLYIINIKDENEKLKEEVRWHEEENGSALGVEIEKLKNELKEEKEWCKWIIPQYKDLIKEIIKELKEEKE